MSQRSGMRVVMDGTPWYSEALHMLLHRCLKSELTRFFLEYKCCFVSRISFGLFLLDLESLGYEYLM